MSYDDGYDDDQDRDTGRREDEPVGDQPPDERPPGDQRGQGGHGSHGSHDHGGPGEHGSHDHGGPGEHGSHDHGGHQEPSGTKFCTECGAEINAKAEICPECGVRQPETGPSSSTEEDERIIAAVLAIALGSFGAHKFYLGETGLGILYLCFSWTFIPGIVGIIEGAIYLSKSDEEFRREYLDT